MIRSEDITEEQWKQIDELCEKHIASQTEQHSDERIEEVVQRMYKDLNEEPPTVLIAPSPAAMVRWAFLVEMLYGEYGTNYRVELEKHKKSLGKEAAKRRKAAIKGIVDRLMAEDNIEELCDDTTKKLGASIETLLLEISRQ